MIAWLRSNWHEGMLMPAVISRRGVRCFCRCHLVLGAARRERRRFPESIRMACAPAGAGLLAMAGFLRSAQQEPSQVPTTGNMQLTDSESLWTGRFSDCDFRYYVVIPNGFDAHGNRPPQRLHGVLFGLPDTSTIEVVAFDDERFISVMVGSNEFDFKSPKEFADHVFNYLGNGKSGFEIRARQASWLDGGRQPD